MEYKKLGGDFAPSWDPNLDDGMNIEGVIEAIDKRTTDYGEYPIITIRTDDNKAVAVHAARSIIKQDVNELLLKHGMKVGDRFGAFYLGPKTSKTGKTYHDYSVAWEAAKPATGGSIKEQIYIVGETPAAPAATSTKPVDTFDVDNF
jgi:hypothetical protein